MKGTPTSRVLWVLRVFDPKPVTDRTIEKFLHDLPGSTVRGARKRLERHGIIRPAGRTSDKRRKWEIAPSETQP